MKNNYLAEWMDLHCLSLREFGKIVGICHSHLSKLCRQKHRPHPRTRREIAEAMQRVDGKDWMIHAQKLK